MKSLEERCLEVEGVVFKMDYGEEGSFYAQVVLADPAIGITAKALENLLTVKKGSECLCLNNKSIIRWHDEIRLEKEFEFVLNSIENRCFITEKLMSIFYSDNGNGRMSECAFK